jgi:polyribonucleotide nucleotidyltransferase
MITPEQLIAQLSSENEKLTQELAQAQTDILDFEQAGTEWMKGFTAMQKDLKIKLEHSEQIVQSLREELAAAKRQISELRGEL